VAIPQLLVHDKKDTVGVVAVDPSSPLSGGAVLGDRVRMPEHGSHENVFVRSVASRGHLGGLSRATSRIVDVMDAAGFDTIIVETVGAGQSEVDQLDVPMWIQQQIAGLDVAMDDMLLVGECESVGGLAHQLCNEPEVPLGA